jgi:CheY-like chemotaxis protein
MSMPEPAPSGPTILVAEDNVDQRTLYVAILGNAGYRVLEAGDGEEAVAVAQKNHPRLVIMDVTMPGAGGWNAVRVLRADPDTRDIPIVVVTGLAASWDRDASYAAGADSHLAKPVMPSRLLEEVRKFITQ